MKKRIITILLAVIMMVVFMPVVGTQKAYATDKTADQAIAWAKSQVGHHVGYDDGSGYYQCVEFIQAYYKYLGVGSVSGSGYQYATNALPAGWTRTAGGVPQKGDILVYSIYSANVQQYGHVAIYESDNSLYDQDGSVYQATVKNERKNYRTYTYNYWGCIHPNFASPVNHNPTIAFDGVEVKPGKVRVTGWAFDPDDPTRSIDVHVYLFVNGNPTCIGGTTANKSRKDVDNALHVGEFHGFDATFDTRIVGNADAQVAAINIGEGSNVWSDKKHISVPNPNPIGYIDSVTDNGSSVKVTGWAFDPSDTSRPIEVHVYIGGSSGSSGAEGHNGIIANLERKDVNKAYKCGDYHGFSAVIPTKKLGSQQVFIYGINIGSGWDNTCFGSKTVNITKHTHALVKTPARAATTSAEGNIEYWTCSGCGKCFSDAAGKNEITKAQTVISKHIVSEPAPTLAINAKISKPKAAKGAVTVKWKKISKKNQKKISGVQIQIATDPGFNSIVKTATAGKKKTSKKIKGLAKKATYYVRVRTYKGGEIGTWSGPKKFKTK